MAERKPSQHHAARTRRIRQNARDAIALIKARGWKQGSRKRTAVCLWEAIWATERVRNDTAPNVVAKIESLICATTKMRHTFGGKKLIPRWNDAPGRTVNEVIAMLEAVASGREDKMPFHYRDHTGRLTNGV